MRVKISWLLLVTIILNLLIPPKVALADTEIALVKDGHAAPIYIDPEGSAYDGLSLIAESVAGDITAITGETPEIKKTKTLGNESVVIIAGVVTDQMIQDQATDWNISASKDDLKSADWERYEIKVLTEGGQTRIVVGGADKRGTIYGLFHITQDLCGVSPWIWWAEAKPLQQDTLSFTKEQLETVSKRPSVNYRGFFLNDENPCMDGFADSHFGGLNYMFYDHIYELMLRLKGNFLWPAMWSNQFNLDGMEGIAGNPKFEALEKEYHDKLGGVMYIDKHGSEDGITNINTLSGNKIENGVGYMVDGEYPMSLANAVLADRYGVTVGASHHEPMARAGGEWNKFKGTYYNSNDGVIGGNKGVWNYLLNKTNINNFWSDSIARNGNFNNLLTVGMRGDGDAPIADQNGVEISLQDNIKLLKQVLADQKQILNKYNVSKTPQLIALYKEVENCWYGGKRDNPGAAENGLRNDPDAKELLKDDIIMYCEDNNGYLRTLAEYGAKDDFNYGLYYHFDYVGTPHTSMWINTMPLQRTWDNLTTAYEYGVDDAWIVNVGDLKPMELPLTYFMDLAYDFGTYGTSNPNSANEYTVNWAKKQFAGNNELDDNDMQAIADILTGYTDMNGNRKPEQLGGSTYSITSYNEAQEHLAKAIALETKAKAYLEKFKGKPEYDAFYQLVYYPAAATANVNKLWVFYGLNQLYADQGSVLANTYAALVDEALKQDRALTAEYNTLGGQINGLDIPKWQGMMITAPDVNEVMFGKAAKAHLNYQSWNAESALEIKPAYVTAKSGTQLIVNVQGDTKGYSSGTASLPDFENTVKQAYAVTISNGGSDIMDYEVANSSDWIKINGNTTGSFYAGTTLGVSVDWDKVTEDKSGTFTITGGGKTVTVQVNAKVTDTSAAPSGKAAFPSQGEFSIVANNYADKGSGQSKNSETAAWEELENYGKSGSTMKMFPAYTDDCSLGEGPWLDYKVYVPAGQEGNYKLTAFVGQSNNLSFDEGAELNVGLRVDDGDVLKKNTLDKGYIAGAYSGSWGSNIKNAGRTADFGTYTLAAGEHTIRVYGMDQNVMLQKLVLSKDGKTKTSYLGPKQSYYKDLGEVTQQPLVYYQPKETMTFPGTILAKDCENEGIDTTENGALIAEPGTEYTYKVVVPAGEYLFGVTGKRSGGSAAVSVKVDDNAAGTFMLGEDMEFVNNEDELTLTAGMHTIKVSVSSDAEIASITGELYDNKPGRLMTVDATGGDAANAYKAVDRKNSSAWSPTESDPSITLNMSEDTYADNFVLTGDFTNVTDYTLEVSSDGDSWENVYTGEKPANGSKIFVQGMNALKGNKWRFSFTGKVTKLAEIKLNTYTNWALEDNNLKITTTNTGTAVAGAVENLVNGNRQGPREQGWQVPGEATITMNFGSPRSLTGMNLIGMQESVSSGSGNGVVPSDTVYSGKAPTSFAVRYQKADGTWSNAITVQRSDASTRSVLAYIDFGSEVSAKAVEVRCYGAQETRMMEIEAIQAVSYTVNGVDRNSQNWALASSGGKVTSYTDPSGSGAKEQAKLNDGIRVSDDTNDTRVKFDKPGAGKHLFLEIALNDTVKLENLIIVSQQKEPAGQGKEPTDDLKNGFPVAPVMIEYYDGKEWVAAGTLESDGGYNTSSVLRYFTPEDEQAIVTNRIRLHYDETFNTDAIRLIEVEAYGKPAEMPGTPENQDPTDGLINYALSSQGASAAATAGYDSSGNPAYVIDGDLTKNNRIRWQSKDLPASITIDLAGEKKISVIDVISQLPDNHATGIPTLEDETNLGLKDIVVSYWDGTNWQAFDTGSTSNTKVWQRFVKKTPVSASKIKVDFPASSGSGGYARVIEIQAWGADDSVDPENSYQLSVKSGTIKTINDVEIGAAEYKVPEGARVSVSADSAEEGQIFSKWKVNLFPKDFVLGNLEDKTIKFQMPKGDVTLEAEYKKASPSEATPSVAYKADPEGFAYADQKSLDDLLLSDDIITEADQDILDKGGKVSVTVLLQRKAVSAGSSLAKKLAELFGDPDETQTAFLMESSLSKQQTQKNGDSKTYSLATASEAVKVYMSVPETWQDIEPEDYRLVHYEETEEGELTAEEVSYDWVTDHQIAFEASVNGTYAMVVPVFYTVTFKDYNGEVLKTVRVKAGESAAAPEDPEREGYLFKGWDKEFNEVRKNTTVTAKYIKENTEGGVVDRLEGILDALDDLDPGDLMEIEGAVQTLIKRVNAVDYSNYTNDGAVMALLEEIENRMVELPGISSPYVDNKSQKISDATVNGALFGLEGQPGYLRIQDVLIPSKLPSGLSQISNAIALDIKLFNEDGSNKPVKGLLKITLDLPETIDTEKEIVVIHYKDGSSDGSFCKYSLSGNQMVLVVDSLSTFTIANVNAGTKETDGDSSDRSDRSDRDVTTKVSSGAWLKGEKGWWYRNTDGSWPKKSWKKIFSQGTDCWYYFNEEGYMATGWLQDADGQTYYLEETKDQMEGRMAVGWKLIDGTWYYFNAVSDGTMGALYKNKLTPDGYFVNDSGMWVQ